MHNTNQHNSWAFPTLILCGLLSVPGFGQGPGTITTIAGTGTAGYNGDNQAATNAQLNVPPAVSVDSQGNIYIADQKNNRIRKVSTTGQITTIAGTGAPGFSGDGGLATAATLNTPTGVFADTLGNIYINDTTNQRIRKINSAGVITTVAGNGTAGYNNTDGIAATSANLFNAGRVVADGVGNLYIADQSNHRIRKVDTNGIITTIAGTGVQGYNGDGAALSTQLNNPTALALDGAGNIYFSDQFNQRIREITAGTIVTIAGTGVAGYNGDGASLSTQLNYPGGLVVDPTSGAIYFVDCANYRVRKISADRTQITTVAGNGTAGYNGDNIPAATAEFSALVFGIAEDSSGNLYIADASSDRIREISSFNSLTFVGSMPHLAAQDGWNTTFTFVNKGTTSVAMQNSMFDFFGVPLTLPITEPQTGNTVNASSVSTTLAPNASFIMEASGPSPTLSEGSAQLSAGGNVDGFAVFHFDPTQQEAVVPLETRNASSYLLPFDNTAAVVTGVAVANVSSASATIPVIIRDDTGAQLEATSLTLSANGHTSYVLSDMYPLSANIRGTIEFDTPSGAQISVLGIRYTPPGTTTTIPSLANIGTGGGLIAHLAFSGGWQTSFILVNNGSTAASATLNYYADNGTPLTLPLTYVQTGATGSASSITQTIAPHASLWLQATGPAGVALVTGSAQLATTGNIGGYVIFRYNTNGQEAVVPIETRNANGYIVAFDNTSNIDTGIAISVASPNAQSIPVVVRDDKGNLLSNGSGFMVLSGNGHSSFDLIKNFSLTAGIRGTIEFDKPAGTSISVIGIRSPPFLTFTSLPPLAK